MSLWIDVSVMQAGIFACAGLAAVAVFLIVTPRRKQDALNNADH